jgi:hypothetical protein
MSTTSSRSQLTVSLPILEMRVRLGSSDLHFLQEITFFCLGDPILDGLWRVIDVDPGEIVDSKK